MRRYIPINFTHIADIDGVGCAVLSKIAFNGDFVNGGEGYFQSPFIVPKSNYTENTANSFNMTRFKEVVKESFDAITSNIYNCIGTGEYEIEPPEENKSEDITFIIIVTDICIPWEEISKLVVMLKDEYPDCDIKLWDIDHHTSNPSYRKTLKDSINIVDFCYEGGCLDDSVTICTSSVNKPLSEETDDFTKRNFVHLNSKKASISEEEYRYNLLTEYGFYEHPEADRSATFLYFLYLYETGLLDHLTRDQFISTVKFVYHVSNYDTFEFDKLDGCMTVKSEVPDALTVLYKSYHGDFFTFMNLMFENICIASLHYGEPLNQTYPDIPLTEDIIIKLDTLYSERLAQFNADLRVVRVVPYSIVRRVLGIKSNELKETDLVAIYPKDITDASFTGNTLLKMYNIKLVIMLYTSSCTLSIRSNNHDLNAPDARVIAQEFGGGGHPNASGCTLSYNKIIELMKLAWYTIPGISDDLKIVKDE